ncbi:MAG: flippase [Candidatus Diapherotrites archaeon]
MEAPSLLKGSVYLLVAQAVFVGAGYAVQIFLGRLLGPALYGNYGVVVSVVSLISLICISGIGQAVSKFVAEDKERAEAVKQKALLIQLVLSTVVGVIYFLSAGFIALLLNDASLTPLIQISALMLPGYALFSVFTSYFNGTREYGKQSIIQIIYNIAKFILIVGLALAGFSVGGAMLGFALAPILGLISGFLLTGWHKTNKKFKAMDLVKFGVPAIIFSMALSFTIESSLLSVKAIMPADSAGYYNAAYQIARVLVFFTGALTGVLFPVVSHSTHNLLKEETKMHVQKIIKYMLIFLVPGAIVLFALPEQLMNLFFGSKYLAGAEALSILGIALFVYSFYTLFATILLASNKPKQTMLISIFVILIALLLNFTFIPIFGLDGPAFGIIVSSSIGAIICYLYAKKKIDFSLPKKSISNTFIAGLALLATAYFIKLNGILFILEAAALVGLYFGILILLKEITVNELIHIASFTKKG